MRLASENQWMALEHAEHFKTGMPKKLYKKIGTEANEVLPVPSPPYSIQKFPLTVPPPVNSSISSTPKGILSLILTTFFSRLLQLPVKNHRHLP